LLMKYRDEVLRFLDRVAMYFKEELWCLPSIC
jgi:hypothetical protein